MVIAKANLSCARTGCKSPPGVWRDHMRQQPSVREQLATFARRFAAKRFTPTFVERHAFDTPVPMSHHWSDVCYSERYG
jgi:hypothetical protein